jgi:hypothetical protein
MNSPMNVETIKSCGTVASELKPLSHPGATSSDPFENEMSC